MNDLFTAVGEATEEAICNALVAGHDMAGIEVKLGARLAKKGGTRLPQKT
jgi:L-aminopeptidase/D-esterase-like protein